MMGLLGRPNLIGDVLRRYEAPLWLIVTVVLVGVAVLFPPFRLLVFVALLACAATVLWPGWWPALRKAAQFARGWVYARFDTEPAFWTSPAQNEDHAGMRADYERLVGQEMHSAADLLTIAELVGGLQVYGDNPWARPPTLRRQAMASIGVGGLMGSTFGRYLAIGAAGVFALMVAGMAVLWGQTQSLKAARDAACSSEELTGVTTREPCRDLASAAERIDRLEFNLGALRATRAGDVGASAGEARETLELNQRSAARDAAARDRQRRARDDDQESLRDARAPDWDQRLRDVTTPLPLVGSGAGGGEPAGEDPAGRVPAGRTGTGELPAAEPAAEPERTDRPAGGA